MKPEAPNLQKDRSYRVAAGLAGRPVVSSIESSSAKQSSSPMPKRLGAAFFLESSKAWSFELGNESLDHSSVYTTLLASASGYRLERLTIARQRVMPGLAKHTSS